MRPYSIGNITDLAIGASNTNVLANIAKATLKEDSIVVICAQRESVDVTFQAVIGNDEVYPASGCNLEAAVGAVPSVQNDKIVVSMGMAGEQIQIVASNANAAAQELSILVLVIPESTIAALPQFLQLLG